MSSTNADLQLLQGLLQFTITLARQAGDLIRQGSKAVSTVDVDEKKNTVDLVTKWDKAVEALVKDKISATYGSQFELCVPYPFQPPKWGINICPDLISIGEESYTDGTRRSLTDVPTFCVDPIGIVTRFKPETLHRLSRAHRRNYQLRAWLPLCVCLYWHLVQERTSYRGRLQSVPRSAVLCPEGSRCIS
jgi:hypothetical protein